MKGCATFECGTTHFRHARPTFGFTLGHFTLGWVWDIYPKMKLIMFPLRNSLASDLICTYISVPGVLVLSRSESSVCSKSTFHIGSMRKSRSLNAEDQECNWVLMVSIVPFVTCALGVRATVGIFATFNPLSCLITVSPWPMCMLPFHLFHVNSFSIFLYPGPQACQ